MLLMDPPAWEVRGQNDMKAKFVDWDGSWVAYDELLKRAEKRPGIMEQSARSLMEERHIANQKAMKDVAKVLKDAAPDVIVMIGDDHKEVFDEDNMPAISVYWGEELPYKPVGTMAWPYDPKIMPDLWYWQDERSFPVASEQAERLIGDLIEQEFDVAHQKYFKEGHCMSHSFGYNYRNLIDNAPPPVVPITINSYYPPNQMTPRRAYKLGKAIRTSIEAWPEDLRVAVIATGGLSHFIVDEEFDREFLDILASKDIERHAALPREKLQSGNSELRCWTVLAGAVDHMDMHLIDYIPCYRTPGGTGCGMAFAHWS